MRYTDRELKEMEAGAAAIERLVAEMPVLKDLIHGKALYLRHEILAEAAARQIDTALVMPEV